MTPTDELRAMLDERGVEWGDVRSKDGSTSRRYTEWQIDGNQGMAIANEWIVGGGLSIEVYQHNLTPEQAIAATLGQGTCELESVITFFKGQPCTTYACKSCGARFESYLPTVKRNEYRKPRFCPSCGRKVQP